MLTVTDHGKEVGVIDGLFLGLGVAYIAGAVDHPTDRQTEVGTECVHDHRVADVRRLHSGVSNEEEEEQDFA